VHSLLRLLRILFSGAERSLKKKPTKIEKLAMLVFAAKKMKEHSFQAAVEDAVSKVCQDLMQA
jgi:hypothetical protein